MGVSESKLAKSKKQKKENANIELPQTSASANKDIKDMNINDVDNKFNYVCKKSIESIEAITQDSSMELKKLIENYTDTNTLKMKECFNEFQSYQTEHAKNATGGSIVKSNKLTPAEVKQKVHRANESNA